MDLHQCHSLPIIIRQCRNPLIIMRQCHNPLTSMRQCHDLPIINVMAPDASMENWATHFVTTWDTNATASESKNAVEIHVGEGVFLYDVDWDNDGTFEDLGRTGSVRHEYERPGVHTVRIRGTFPHFRCRDPEGRASASLECGKLLAVEQWGTGAWESMEGAYFLVTSERRSFMVAVSSPPSTVNSTGRRSNFLMVW